MRKRIRSTILILTAMIAMLLPIISANADANENWINVGDAGFTWNDAAYTSLAFDSNDIPYVAFWDLSNGGKATVLRYYLTTWELVGNMGFSDGHAPYTSLAFDSNNTPYVAFTDFTAGKRTTVMKCDGSTWVNVGNAGFSAGEVYKTCLAIDNNDIPYVAYNNGDSGYKATVMKYDGSSWANVGNAGFSEVDAENICLAIDSNNTPYLAFTDVARSERATVMKFDGTSWVYVGDAGFSNNIAKDMSFAIDSNDTPYIAFGDSANSNKATVMKYDGNSWVNVGDTGFSKGATGNTCLAFNSNDTPYVAYVDSGNGNKATVMKFDGTSWVTVGNAGFSAGNIYFLSLAIDSHDMPYLSYKDYVNNGKATVMKLNVPPTGISLDDNEIWENEPIGSIVGAFSTVESDTNNEHTYTLVSGTGDTDNYSFIINGNKLTAVKVFDYETKNTYSVRVRSTDNGGLYTESEFSIEVQDVDEHSALAIDTPNILAGTIGESYSSPVSASGGDGNYSWYSSGLPSGLSIARDTGTISGTPNKTGTFSVKVRVYDGKNKRAEKTYSLTVNSPSETGKYQIVPDTDNAYTVSTEDGFTTLKISSDVSGFRYVDVVITPIIAHEGNETVVFTHTRNGEQIGVSFNKADFDITGTAGVGFNVQAGDAIKIYVVDELSNDPNINPVLLQ